MPPSAEYRGERGKEKQESHNTHVSPARSGGTHSSSFSDVQPTSRVWKGLNQAKLVFSGYDSKAGVDECTYGGGVEVLSSVSVFLSSASWLSPVGCRVWIICHERRAVGGRLVVVRLIRCPVIKPSFESWSTPTEYIRYEIGDLEASDSVKDAQKFEYLRLDMLRVLMGSIRSWLYRSQKTPCHFTDDEEYQ
ncbi:hypothetical protein COCCADRAFT_22203 [Bipolaris zeicola 26-R-13]|uniref:Uncharacterized protein n=1 Tax=Cochliobolus carbonum (strain 26-R-13) TaxID=930089 RepID=W6YSF6_COCC2|nr:uncharacterized protein COCCADRAFT_22203 [Bipolaris zeicola 26-R-13]EUC38334.1 hypothetical protein COCCADRAFT_22203 [Bipolaris zeicola 26-R-13]